MLFTIKIIRFVIGLFVKALLLPFKLVARIVGGGSSGGDSGDSYEFDPEEPASTTTGERTDAEPAAGTPSADAVQRIGWFRKGLFAVGAIQLLLGLGMMVGVSGLAMRAGGAMFVGGIIVAVVLLSAIPIVTAALLSRHPTGAWYAGMGFLVLSALISIAGGLAGVVWAAVYGAVAYCGYEGRPALATVYGDETPSTGTSQPTDPATSSDQPASADTSSTQRARSNEPTASAEPSPNEEPSSRPTATGSPSQSSEPSGATAGGTATADEDPPTADDGTAPVDAASGAETVDAEAGAETDAASAGAAGDAETDAATPEDTSDAESADGSQDAGDSTVSAYRDDLDDPDPAVREAAVADLADAVADDAVPDQAVIDALAVRLDDEDAAVRVAACDALGDLGAAEVTAELRELRIDPDTDVSRAASRALRDIE
jgi:hypothetical protein